MILLQHCLNAEPPGEEWRYYPLFCDMHTGNWCHGKPQAVPTVCSYTVVGLATVPLPSAVAVYMWTLASTFTRRPSWPVMWTLLPLIQQKFSLKFK